MSGQGCWDFIRIKRLPRNGYASQNGNVTLISAVELVLLITISVVALVVSLVVSLVVALVVALVGRALLVTASHAIAVSVWSTERQRQSNVTSQQKTRKCCRKPIMGL